MPLRASVGSRDPVPIRVRCAIPGSTAPYPRHPHVLRVQSTPLGISSSSSLSLTKSAAIMALRSSVGAPAEGDHPLAATLSAQAAAKAQVTLRTVDPHDVLRHNEASFHA